MWTSENNWYKWSYGDGPAFGRQLSNLPFSTSFERYNGPVGTFKEELIKAASSVLDHCDSKPTLLYSGGVDSEIILRSFIEVGKVPEVIIAQYENNYNIYDVSYAVVTCELLGVNYKIVDFSLEKFYENEAMRYAELSQIDRPSALPYCKLLEMVDGFPILGASDLSPQRTDSNYGTPGTWMMRCWEHDIGWSKFLREINKPGIAEWFKWTPGLVLSFTHLEWFKKLVNDRYYGKLGSNSTKILGYKESYPNLLDRKKQTGFEKTDHLINEFEGFLQKKYNGLPYRQSFDRTLDSLCLEITGSLYKFKEITC